MGICVQLLKRLANLSLHDDVLLLGLLRRLSQLPLERFRRLACLGAKRLRL